MGKIEKKLSLLRIFEKRPKLAFLLVAFCIAEFGEVLNIFEGVYLVGLGWHEGSVGIALSLLGFTALIIQPWAGDWIDKTTIDRRFFLVVASIISALSASAILLVREGNADHLLIYVCKIIEGIAASFITPCLAALNLATFGPNHFDSVMASINLWGNIGSVISSILAGAVSYTFYPHVKFCFLVLAGGAIGTCAFIPMLPQGDPLMGRGFRGKTAMDECGEIERIGSVVSDTSSNRRAPIAAAYWDVFTDVKTCIFCVSGFFFQ